MSETQPLTCIGDFRYWSVMNQSDLQAELQSLRHRVEMAERSAVRLTDENDKIKHELAESNRKAEVADYLKSRFLANVSHELRTPMNGILGMAELLLGTELDETQKNFTQAITRSTESLLYTVNGILDFSSLKQSKVELDENIFFFGKMIQDICKQFEHKANAKNLKLTCNTLSSLQVPVIGDEFRIRQIICHLIDNAIKFTESGEVIVTQQVGQHEGIHRITVEDTGAGIPLEVQSDIFKSFSQGDNSSTRRFGGTGLGLSIAHKLAELMSGEITIQSKPGEGSRFTFNCELQAGDRDSINEVGKSTLHGVKALIVDDTETNREILELQLQQWDLDVHSADSGKAALKLLNQAAAEDDPFKLAILDLNMPNMDGLELAQHIQNAEFSHDLRIMMLTSSVIDLSPKALEERGILKSMMKPARQALLYDAILKLLSTPSSQNAPFLPSGRATRILLTEDDPINQEVATVMLETMGYEVVVADNGAMAVDTLVQDNNFDLVLMDCQMPVMDGFNATKAIRDKNFDIPIIALTANAMQGDRELCLDAGMNDYLSKPIYRTDLSRVVHQWASTSSKKVNINKESVEHGSGNRVHISEKNMNIEIDQTALDAIRSLQRPGKPDILARIVNMYMEKSPELIAAIKEGVAANDSDKVKMAAHTLKSSSAYVGAPALAEVCNRVESSATNADFSNTAEDVEMISSGFESVVNQIKQYG